MSLEVCWDGLWALSFGPSQFHGHGSWLVCEVALNIQDEARLLWFNIKRLPVSGLGSNPSPQVAHAAVHACQQFTIWVRNIFSILGSGFRGRHWTPPYELSGGSHPGGGSFRGKFLNPTENYCPSRPASKKILPLYFWRPLDYKFHIECILPSRSKVQYVCSLSLSK